MKCIKCDYSLWNLRQPRCPECSELFDVRDWRFDSKYVAFLCTHCQQKLGPYKPGPIDKQCPSCDQLLDWACVTVEPLIDDVSQIALRKSVNGKLIKHKAPIFAFRILILLIFFFIGSAYFILPSLAGRPKSPPTFLFLICVIGGGAIAWTGIKSAKKEYRTMNIVIWVMILSFWFVLTTQSYLSRVRNYEAYRWHSDSSLNLYNLHKCLQIYLEDNEPPPSLKLLAVEPYALPNNFLLQSSDTTLDDIYIGSFTMQQFIDGDVTSEQLWQEAKQNPIQGEWEVIGDYVFSRRFDLYDNQDPNIIIAMCLIPERKGIYQVLYADGHNEVLAPASGWITAQNKLRKSQGLAPLPKLP